MRITQENLKSVVKRLKPVVPKRSTKPILEYVKMQSVDNTIMFTATDLEIGIMQSVDIERISPIDNQLNLHCLVPFSFLQVLAKRKNTYEYTISLDNDKVTFSAGGFKKSCKPGELSEFPEIPVKMTDRNTCPDNFVESFNNAAKFVADERIRYAINGICIDTNCMVGTNGKWLGKFACNMQGIKSKIIVSLNLVKCLDKNDQFDYGINDNQFYLVNDRLFITSIMLEGHFPTYQDVIPDLVGQNVMFDSKLALVALDDIKDTIDTNEGRWPFHLILNGDLTFSSKDFDAHTESRIDCDFDGEQIDIMFDWNWFQPIIKNFPDFMLNIKDDESPGVFHMKQDRIVIMPIRKG